METKHTLSEKENAVIYEISVWNRHNLEVIEKNKEEFAKDFIYAFEWKAEETYKYQLKYNIWKYFLKDCFHNGYKDAVETFLKEKKQWLSQSYNIRTRSTCPLTSEASTWKYEVLMYEVERFEKLISNIEKEFELCK